METRKIPHLGLLCYQKPKSPTKWHLPVCAESLRARFDRLRPTHSDNWETVDWDGVPTICYRFTSRELRAYKSVKFTSAYKKFSHSLGPLVAKEFWPDLWMRFTNIQAHNLNTWEKFHGGYRVRRFDRGPSLRACASLSL